jgi:ribosomal-protein-alanine N-acetyltransferase
MARFRDDQHAGFLVCQRETRAIVGAVNLSEIVRGPLQTAYLGYFVGAPFAREGYLSEGLRLVVGHAFDDLKLHRLEANIQPGNRPSIALIRGLGFRKEGFSPRYLKVGGRWRDHERWACVAEEWRSSPRPRGAARRTAPLGLG